MNGTSDRPVLAPRTEGVPELVVHRLARRGRHVEPTPGASAIEPSTAERALPLLPGRPVLGAHADTLRAASPPPRPKRRHSAGTPVLIAVAAATILAVTLVAVPRLTGRGSDDLIADPLPRAVVTAPIDHGVSAPAAPEPIMVGSVLPAGAPTQRFWPVPIDPDGLSPPPIGVAGMAFLSGVQTDVVDGAIVATSQLQINGILEPSLGTALSVGGQPVVVTNGRWSTQVALHSGANMINIVVFASSSDQAPVAAGRLLILQGDGASTVIPDASSPPPSPG